MKNPLYALSGVLLLLLVASPNYSFAQGLIDGFSVNKGTLSLTNGYTRGTASDFYRGTEKQDGIPVHGEFTQDIFSLYGKYGITDDLTLIASLPYISITGDSINVDPLNGNDSQSGFQNLQVALKYRLLSLGGGAFNLFGGATGALAGGYVNNGIIAIGNGSNAVDLTLNGQYQLSSGLFFSAGAAYSFRGSADNDFAVQEGNEFDVPNAVIGLAKVGYAGGKLYGEVAFDFQNSTDGVDIGGDGFGGNFPETRVNFSRVGATGYYSITPQFGVSLSYSTFVGGRNVSDFSYLGGGITYSLATK